MDEFKPEDELKPDPSDRRTGRSRQSSERSERTERGEPQINFDDIELDDTDDRRPTRAQKERNEEPEIEEEIDESEDETVDEERVPAILPTASAKRPLKGSCAQKSSQ